MQNGEVVPVRAVFIRFEIRINASQHETFFPDSLCMEKARVMPSFLLSLPVIVSSENDFSFWEMLMKNSSDFLKVESRHSSDDWVVSKRMKFNHGSVAFAEQYEAVITLRIINSI